MKTTKFLAMLFATAALSFTAVSCGNDNVDDLIEDFEDGKPTTKFTKETANELEITISMGGIYKQVHNAKFDANQKTTSYVQTHTYGTKEAAKDAYKALQEEGKATLNGKTVTVDLSEEYAETDYNYMHGLFEQMIAMYK